MLTTHCASFIPKMLLLSLDTSTTVCSVALHQDETLLGCYELFTERTSSAMLTTLINDVVKHTGYELNQLDAIAVAKGPGSYTGLRIGVSTAKGLCFALDKPLLAINTLAAMAEQIRSFYSATYRLCPMIDARRMEVYCAFYGAADGSELRATSAEIIDEQSFSDWLAKGPVVFFGDGAAKCRAALGGQSNAVFLDKLIQPSARTVGLLATAALTEGRFENVAQFEPFYLKEFMTAKPKPLVL
ncbi:MAG: tRNA ((37)-N6)-threonylcarbamoyltransferase complex dimerization subunit type 1 TsaB [Spirosoma sp.]|nr:tRNA ((37)-N6)-threonylcarbamoyltransferase complex dimerization subunit type 1 TsaB [Spirosoma sp.]